MVSRDNAAPGNISDTLRAKVSRSASLSPVTRSSISPVGRDSSSQPDPAL